MLLKAPVENDEHTSTYYAATLGGHVTYPELMGQERADVCVIGGGFSGVSTALHLPERGYRVILLEAARIGWGASGRNGGQILGGFSTSAESLGEKLTEDEARLFWEMGNEAVDIIKARIGTYKIDCDLAWGYCALALLVLQILFRLML